MILSHEHKFIFIRTKKTAGTSVELALSKYCGPDDIITPDTPKDEELRGQLGHPGPQHYLLPLRRYTASDWARLLLKRKRLAFYDHMSAAEVRRLTGEETWNGYFKFCFERNPWDKVVSLYWWKRRKRPLPPISEFLRTGRAAQLAGPNGCGLYMIDGQVAVDRVCMYERLHEEMEYIARRLSLPEVPQLPRAKADFRKDKRHYRQILSEADRALVAEIFAKEIELFGYAF